MNFLLLNKKNMKSNALLILLKSIISKNKLMLLKTNLILMPHLIYPIITLA